MKNPVKREISSRIEWYKKVIFAKNVTRRKMDIHLCDKHLIYSVLISRYEYLDISIEYMRWLSHSWISRYWSWISIFLRAINDLYALDGRTNLYDRASNSCLSCMFCWRIRQFLVCFFHKPLFVDSINFLSVPSNFF